MPSVLLFIIGIQGFLLLRKTIRKLQLRKQLYTNGSIVSATVLKHGRKFNLFKSNKDYTVFVHCHETNQQMELVSGKYTLQVYLPLNTEIHGLNLASDYFFLEEVGCEMILKKH